MKFSDTPGRLIVLMCGAEVLSMTGFAIFPALLPGFMDEWQLSATDAGWINGIFYAGYLISVLMLVSLTDRRASKDIYLVSMVLSCVSALGYGLFAEGFWSAMLFRTLAGVGLAGTYMPGLKLLNDRLDVIRPDQDHSRAIAFYTSSFGIGAAFSYYFSGVASEWTHWSVVFVLSAIGPVLAFFVISFLMPRDQSSVFDQPDTHLLDFRPVLKSRQVMGYVMAYAVHNFELFAFRSWMVVYLTYVAMAASGPGIWLAATSWAAINNIIGLPASLLGNEAARRFGRRRVITIVMLISAVVSLSLGLVVDMDSRLVMVLVIVYAVTVPGDSSSITAGAIAAAPKGYRGQTMAVHSSIGFIGSFAGPLLFGVALDAGAVSGVGGASPQSWLTAFLFLAVVVALGPLVLLGVKNQLRVRE